jgi:hypothetical protein
VSIHRLLVEVGCWVSHPAHVEGDAGLHGLQGPTDFVGDDHGGERLEREVAPGFAVSSSPKSLLEMLAVPRHVGWGESQRQNTVAQFAAQPQHRLATAAQVDRNLVGRLQD